MAEGGLIPRRSDLAVAAFLAAIAGLAAALDLPYVLFPELGALTWVIASDRRHPWAESPGLLMLTPLLTGALGLLVTRQLAYGPPAVLLAVGGSLLVVALLRSPVVPALSAGLLPLALGISSWSYPPALLIGTGALALLVVLRRRSGAAPTPLGPAPAGWEPVPPLRHWAWAYALFLLGALGLVRLLGSALVLFPPLLVIAFERIAHRQHCSWRHRPGVVLLSAAAAALLGSGLERALGVTPLAVFLAALATVMVLRQARLAFPPALGMALLPFVIPRPPLAFPLFAVAGCLWLLLLAELLERCPGRGGAGTTA